MGVGIFHLLVTFGLRIRHCDHEIATSDLVFALWQF